MRGFTNAVYRNLFIKHFKGVDAAISPFISTLSCKQIRDSHLKDVLPNNNSALPLVPQIISNDAAGFIQLSKRCYDLGYDTVNWNLGCPFSMVARKKRGSGLLPHPEMIGAFLDRVVPSIPNRLSIKTRIGRKTAQEIFDLIPVFNRYPLHEVVIHPRTGIQLYSGTPDQETFGQSLALLQHPVVYNGDIFDLPTFQKLSEMYPAVNRWMLGRGVLANPFLPAMIVSGNDDMPDKTLTFRRFHDELFAAYQVALSGQGHLVDRMKGYWQYFSRSFHGGRRLFKKMKKLKTADRYVAVVDQFFQEGPVWRSTIRSF